MEKSPSETILASLEAAGTWHSGEDLAERLGVSRAAIAKQVAGLRRQGHVIDSATKRGYWLRIKNEPLALAAIVPHLSTAVLGRKGWRILAETTSTNIEAVTWALSDGEAGAVIAAERQTMGKGRKGHDWFSSPRSLQFSLLLRPRCGGDITEAVTMAGLEALRQAIEETTGLCAEVKKPNDLLLSGRKIAGVLVESGSRSGEPDWLAVGIGCNINAVPDDFPHDISGRVTSLYAESGNAPSRNRLLAATLNALEPRLKQVRGLI